MIDRRRPITAAWLVLALFILAGASLDSPTTGDGRGYAPAPDEGCIEASRPSGATPAATESCQTTGTGTGGGGAGAGVLSNLLPLVAIVGGGLLVIGLAGAIVFMRSKPRHATEPTAGWWTCATCGASNLAEAARCRKCGAWQPFSQSRPGGRITP